MSDGGYDVSGMKVVLSSQTYGPVNAITSKRLRVAVMHAANRGVKWCGDASVDRMAYGVARTTAVQYTFKNYNDANGIMWVDSDIKCEPDSITRLLDQANHNKLDFVSGVYFQREGVHNPVFHQWNPDREHFQPAETYPPNCLGELKGGGCGFGFVYTSLKMLSDIANSTHFDMEVGWFPDKRDVGGSGEDLSFCRMAYFCGYSLWVDTGIQVGHEAAQTYITEADYLREKDIWIKDNKKEKPQIWGPKGLEQDA